MTGNVLFGAAIVALGGGFFVGLGLTLGVQAGRAIWAEFFDPPPPVSQVVIKFEGGKVEQAG